MLKQGEVESGMMQRNRLASRPSLHNRGSGRTNVLAARASWLLVLGRPKVLAHLGQVKVNRSSRGHKEEKMLASRQGSKQVEKARRGNATQGGS